MATFPQSLDRDANRRVLQFNSGGIASKTRVYDGTTGNGTSGITTLFTVVGDVLITLWAYCIEGLAGTGTPQIQIEMGSITHLIISSTIASTIDTGDLWTDISPATAEAVPNTLLISRGARNVGIQEEIRNDPAIITSGQLIFYCLWRPLSSDGSVVAA